MSVIIMRNTFLFITTLLCWSPTWYIIKFQLGYIDPLISVFYRITLAAAILFFILILTKKSLRFNMNQHLWFSMLGLCLFSFNYIFFYLANTYLISGVVTIAFSTNLIFNIVGEKIIYKVNASASTWMAALFGLIGILIIFNNEIFHFNPNDKTHIGIALSFVATFFWSCGNMIHIRNAKNKLPFFPSIAYAMLYGSILTLVAAKVRGAEILFEFSFAYISALLFLSIFGTVVAFYLYLTLLNNIGPGRAGYVGVLMPVLALLISTHFENLEWSNNLIIGLPILIAGSVLILNQKAKLAS